MAVWKVLTEYYNIYIYIKTQISLEFSTIEHNGYYTTSEIFYQLILQFIILI